MKDKKNRNWWILRTIAVILCLLTFTPLVIPKGEFKPELFGIPYSLWTSYLITIALVILTFIGTRLHQGIEEEEVNS